MDDVNWHYMNKTELNKIAFCFSHHLWLSFYSPALSKHTQRHSLLRLWHCPHLTHIKAVCVQGKHSPEKRQVNTWAKLGCL